MLKEVYWRAGRKVSRGLFFLALWQRERRLALVDRENKERCRGG
jgi:hypothetical protein